MLEQKDKKIAAKNKLLVEKLDAKMPSGYKLHRCIGEGTFGFVCSATRIVSKRKVRCAIKFTKLDDRESANEAEVITRVKGASHFNKDFIIDVSTAFIVDG